MNVVASRVTVCALIVSLSILAGCRRHRIPGPVSSDSVPDLTIPLQNADSIALLSVRLAHGNSLDRGQPVDMVVTIQYTLATRDSAFLKLDLDQFPNRESCVAQAENNGTPAFATPVAKEVPISRGTHTLVIPVAWPGDTENGTTGPTLGAGAVSFRASLRTSHPDYEFLTRRFGTEYCMRF